MFGYGHVNGGTAPSSSHVQAPTSRQAYAPRTPPSDLNTPSSSSAHSKRAATGGGHGGRTIGRLSQSHTFGGGDDEEEMAHGSRRRGGRFTEDELSRTLDDFDASLSERRKPPSSSSQKRDDREDRHRHREQRREDKRDEQEKEAEHEAPDGRWKSHREKFFKAVLQGKHSGGGNQPSQADDATKSEAPRTLDGRVGSDGILVVSIQELQWHEVKTPQSFIFIGPKQSGKTSILFNLFSAFANRFEFVFIFTTNKSTARQMMHIDFPAFIIEEFNPAAVTQVLTAAEAVLEKYGIVPSVAILIDDYLTEPGTGRNKIWPAIFKRAHHAGISSFYAVHNTTDIEASARPSAGLISIGFNATDALKRKVYDEFFKTVFENYHDFCEVYKKTVVGKGQSLVLMDTEEHGYQVRYLKSHHIKKLKPFSLCCRDTYVLMHMYGKDPSTWRKLNTGGVEIDNSAAEKIRMAFSEPSEKDKKAVEEAETQKQNSFFSHTIQKALALAQRQKKTLSAADIAALGGKRFIIE